MGGANPNKQNNYFIPFHLFEKRARFFLFLMLLFGLVQSLREKNSESAKAPGICHDTLSFEPDLNIPVICSKGAKKQYQLPQCINTI